MHETPRTLLEVLTQRAFSETAHRKQYAFLGDSDGEEASLSARELHAQAARIGALLQAQGAQGQRVLLLYPPGLDYVAGFFGCLYAGAVAVPAYPPDPVRLERTLPRLRAIIQDAEATVVLTTSGILSLADFVFEQAPDFRALKWLATDELPVGGESSWIEPQVSPGTLAFLQYTSGSTGTPKGVMLSHANLIHNLGLIAGAFQTGPQSSAVIWLPPYHDMGLIGGILQPLFAGFPVTLMSPMSFLQRPMRWLEAVSRYGGTISGGPNFAFELCARRATPEDIQALDLRAWDVAFCGAEPIRAATLDRFAEVFAPSGFRREAFYPCYGLAEGTLIVTGEEKGRVPRVHVLQDAALGHGQAVRVEPGSEGSRTHIGCGSTLAEQRLLIVDPESRVPRALGQVGEIWVSGGSVAQGYWRKPEDSVDIFQAVPVGAEAGPKYLRTGDLGLLLEDGQLIVTGRRKDLIILRGRNLYPQDVESIVERAHRKVRPGCIAAFDIETPEGEALAVVAEVSRDLAEGSDPAALGAVADALRKAIVAELQVQPHTLALLPPGSVMKTSSGKIQRFACRAALVSGELPIVWRSGTGVISGPASLPAPAPTPAIQPALSQEALETALREELVAVLGAEAVGQDASTPLTLLGLDSLGAADLQGRVEKRLGVRVSIAALLQDLSLRSLAESVSAEGTGRRLPPLQHRPAGDAPTPASFTQERLWYLLQLDPSWTSNQIPVALTLRGTLDVAALERALSEVLRRHEVLRTRFASRDGALLQRVQAPGPVSLPCLDFTGVSGDARQATLEAQAVLDAQSPMDLEAGPLVRCSLLRFGPEDHVLLTVLHHLVVDGTSVALFMRELAALYGAFVEGRPSPLAEPEFQYGDFAAWQRAYFTPDALTTELSWWKETLAGAPQLLALPTDRSRPQRLSVHGARRLRLLPASLMARLHALGRRQGATPFMSVMSALATVLHRWSGQSDFVVGTVISGRDAAGTRELMGDCTNFIPLRVRLPEAATSADMLSEVKSRMLGALAHGYVPFEQVLAAVQQPGAERRELYNVGFILDDYELPRALSVRGGLTLDVSLVDNHTAELDMTFEATHRPEGLLIGCKYSADLFDAETADRLLSHLEHVIRGMVEAPDAALTTLPLMSDAERQHALHGWNPRVEAPPSGTLTELIEAQVERTPDAVAVAFESERLTYRELDARANQVAHHLRSLGVAPESLVGVCLERSVDMVVALLGVLKAGAAYVPVDPAYPKERLGWMLEDTGASVLLTHEKWKSVLPPSAARVVCLDSAADEVARHPVTRPSVRVGPESLAYVIFTSGSTGRPKGAMNAHGGVVNRLKWMQEEYGLNGTDVVLQKTPFSFDVSVWEFFWPLLAGAKLVVARPGGHQEPAYLVKLMKAEGVTTVHFVPSMLRAFVEEPGLEGLGSLRRVVCSGEALSAELAKKAYARLPAPVRVHNLYGPTEAAVDVTYWPCPRGEDFHRVPIGRPVANTVLYVLDTHGQPAPVGIPGELHIGGVQVGRGYWQRPQLTAERFIPDAFSGIPGARLYRTGDVARWLADGTLEYLGRADFQVKLRGFRIELGEIETALAADPAVRDSVVMAREDSTGDQRLVAYVVLDDAAAAQEVDASSQWQAIYDEAYARETPESEDPTFNIVGWEDSYTGEPLPPAQMREWVDTTVAQILSFQPKRVLELGCGTGLLLYRLAPRCEAYWGVDFARPALDRIERQRERMGGALDSVHLLHRSVDDFSGLEPGSFDTVVINSVVQYFSSPEFLLDVLRGAVRVLKPGGRVFLGDVRSLELLEAFRASVRLHRTAGPVATSQFAYRVQRDILAEKELVLSPAFFTALPDRIPGIQRVEVLPKHGRYDNELSRFRYEVIFHVGDAAKTPARRSKPDWVDGAGFTLDRLREQLSAGPGLLAVRGLPNARVLEPTRLVELLSATPPPTVAGLREALHDWPGTRGVEPEDLYALGTELGYEVRVSWASAHRNGALDVVFARPGEVDTLDLSPEPKQVTSWDGLASDPLRGARSAQAVSRLRDTLADKLPPHMVPSAFVVLPALPLSPNGKVDRKALPSPEAERLGAADAFIAPRTPTEEKVARIFGEILGQSRVGANDDFFALGGHSLLATQVVVRVRAQLNTEISLRTLFDAPTVARLAERIESQAQLADASGVPALVPLERGPSADKGLAASFAQQRLWFLEQLHPGQAAYNLPAALRLTGQLDVDALRRTFLEVVRRHEAVRTTFVTREGQPAQRIQPAPAEWPLPEEDLRGLEPEARDAAVQARMAEEAHHAFDLEKGPLLRTVLLHTGADAHVLLLCMHHIVSDGWSIGVLVREVAALYEALSQGREASLPALTVQYADYAAWQRRVLEGPALAPQLNWWRSRLEGAPTLELPTDHARPAVRSGKGASYFFSLSSEQVAGLERVASAHNATLYMVLMAGWQALLARYSGQTDFCVGTSVAHRTRPELEGLIGFFVNTLALRANVDGDPRFDELVARVREESLAAFANQDVPFDRLVEVLGGQRDLSRTPLFQAAFVLQNAPMQPPTLPGMVVDVLHTGTDTARFDVTALLVERGGRLDCELEYSLDLFTPETARRMVEHFQRLLRGVVEDAACRISAVPLWSEAERHEVLVDWNDTAAPYPADTTVHQRFMEQAQRTPQAIAVEHEGRLLTYEELDARSNQLAHHLRSLGLGTESRVGVFLHRGLDLLVGLLGILKAGGAYVPLAPEYPAQRLAFMAEDSGVAAILTESALEDELPAGSQLIVVLDDEWARIERQPSTPVTGGLVGPEQLAYITYTSGSTGMPKGVAIPHRGVVRLLIGSRFVDLGPSEVVLQLAPLAFDASTLEIWGALLHGARLVLYPQRTPDLAELGQALVRHQVSVLWLTAALFEQMQQHQPEALGQVRQLLAGGDVLPAPRVRERLAQGVGLVNGYGPTEGTTFTACHRMAPGDVVGDSVSIGRPIANTQVYVLDSAMRAVPVGVPGEVFIGGDGLARGYLGQPALTAERFVPNPFGPLGARLYRSGDRARWQADGTLQFLGRVDFQVKLRGFRIELGEVEAALRNHSAVETAIAVVREDIPGDRRLVAYVTPEDVDTASVREHLRQRLPEYMVPNAVVALGTLPLSPNGKVDRKALPAPDLVGLGAADFVAPRTELEQQLALLFSEVLGLERAGLNDDFFELGGHSLLATQVVTRLRAQLGVDLPLRTFFEAPTVARLAARLESAPRTSTLLPLESLPRPAQGEATFDVSFAQQRLWFLDQLQPGQFTYNVPAALELKGRLDEEALRRTFLEVVRRHEAVRTTFVTREGQPAQRIHPAPAEWPLPVEDLSGLAPEARDATAQARMVEEAHRAFDLEKGPLLRTVLLRTGPDVHVLLLSMHHIISDGWSMGVLVREVAALYEALSQGREASLPALTVQYADYAAWQRRVLEGPALAPQLSWWRSRLEGAPTLELPTDHPRPAVRTLRGATQTFTLPPSLVAGLERVASAHNATLYMVLMAGWQALLARYSGQTDFCVGTPVAHRTRPELEGLIGFFVNTLALRANVDGDPRFDELVARVREESLAAFANQDVPFDRLVEVLGGQRDLSRTPLFQAAFVLQNAPMQPPTLPGMVVEVLRTGTDTARFDVTALLVERGGRLDGELEYSLDLFTPETARRMVEHFQRLLRGVVEDAARRISAVPLWSEAERHEVLVAWNDTAAPYPADTTVHQRFMEQARRTPERVAVTFEGRSLTYAELDARSNQLARHLVSLGLEPEARIGVCASRGLELVIGVLGALKAGGCYVPLDPSWPVKRLEHASSLARLSAVLTWQSLLPSLKEGPWHVVALDADAADIARQSPEAVQVPAFPEGLAFATFTSGSTGTPKGVALPHRGLLRLSEGSRFLTQAPEEVTLQLSPLAFDVSSVELWGTLLHGGKLVVYPPGTPEPDAVARLIVEHKVSWLILATSLFELMQQHQPDVLARVPNLLTGGEAMPAPRARERLARGVP